MLDTFHIVKLTGDAPGEVRRRVQQDTLGHCGRTGDPLYLVRNFLRATRDRLTKRQQERLRAAFTADGAHISLEVAYHCAQQVREVFHRATPTRRIARGYRNPTNYQLRMLLIVGGLDASIHTQL